jgi:hypothetical protein
LPLNPRIRRGGHADVIPPLPKRPPKINMTFSTRNYKSNPLNDYSIRVWCLNIPNSYLHFCLGTVVASKPEIDASAHLKLLGKRPPKLI